VIGERRRADSRTLRRRVRERSSRFEDRRFPHVQLTTIRGEAGRAEREVMAVWIVRGGVWMDLTIAATLPPSIHC